MRRLALALLLLALAVEVPSAQFRGRFHRNKTPAVDLSPTISFDTPTASSAFSTTASSVNIGGVAVDDKGITSVTWVNDRGGSGTATLTGEGTFQKTWSVTASAGDATIGQHDFATGTNTDLVSVAPSIGTAWVERVDGGADSQVIANAADATAGAAALEDNTALIYTLTPSSALSGTDYTASAKRADTGSTNSSQPGMIIFRYVDSSNYCALEWRTGGNLRVRIRQAGANGTVATATGYTLPVGATAMIDVNGSTIKAYADGVEKISTTSAFCGGTAGDVGIGFGSAIATGDDISPNVRIDDFTLIDRGGTTPGVALQSGVNVITVTVTDTLAQTSTDVLTITRDVADTTVPTASFLAPSSGAVTVAAQAITGIAADNVGVSSVTWSCPNCSGSTSGTASGTTSWGFMVTLTCDGTTVNTITVTAHDAAMNDSAPVSIALTCTSADVTAPSIVITTNGGGGAGANYSTTSATVSISGTAADEVGGSGLDRIVCTNSLGGSQQASGTTAWTISTVTLAVGANVLSCISYDLAGNQSTADTQTVTRTVGLTATISGLPQGFDGVAYNVCLTASGGTGPYTWTLQSGTLPAWASIALDTTLCGTTNRYKVTGTPNAVATTPNLVFRVTDNAAATADTAALSLTIATAGSDYYTSILLSRGDKWKFWDFRAAGVLSGLVTNPYITYNPGADTDPHAQNAAKFRIPFWAQRNFLITSTIPASGAYHDCPNRPDLTGQGISCFTWTNGAGEAGSQLGNFPCKADRWFRHSNEVFNPVVGGDGRVCFQTSANVREGYVQRAHNGSSAVAHSANAAPEFSVNSLPSPRLQLQFNEGTQRGTADGQTYVYVWRYYVTDSYMGNGFGNQKTFNFFNFDGGKNTSAISLEPNYAFWNGVFTASAPCNSPSVAFNPATDVAGYRVRNYHAFGGPADWTLTNGETMGPGTTDVGDSTCPMSNAFVVKPNTWVQHVVRIEQRANDYDYLTVWIMDETRDPVKILDAIPYSISHNPPFSADHIGTDFFDYELNTSGDSASPNRISGPNQYGDYVSYSPWFMALRQAGLITDGTLTDAALASSGVLAKVTQP